MNTTFSQIKIESHKLPEGLKKYFEPALCGECYVCRMVDVFREVRRVLHPRGTVWLNLGDSYNGSGGYYPDSPSNLAGSLSSRQDKGSGAKTQGLRNVNGLGPKQLLGIPWRTAFALQADGWVLRSEIIWHKRAPMPESVTDRCTKAHEQVFLLAKSATYYYDADAIREPNTSGTVSRLTSGSVQAISKHGKWQAVNGKRDSEDFDYTEATGRNKRSVWTLGPESYAGAHFATMPTKLVEPCILAGSSARGCCAACGAPWARVVERTNGKYSDQADVVPCTVLDCFAGSGTVGFVSLRHGRNFIGIDLSADYLELARTRIEQSQPMLFEV